MAIAKKRDPKKWAAAKLEQNVRWVANTQQGRCN